MPEIDYNIDTTPWRMYDVYHTQNCPLLEPLLVNKDHMSLLVGKSLSDFRLEVSQSQ